MSELKYRFHAVVYGIVGAIASTFISGCGPTLTTVEGKVTLNGKPVQKGDIILIASDGISYSGKTDIDGNYRITNVPVGDVKIGVNGWPPDIGIKPKRGPGSPDPIPKDVTKVPVKYRDPTTSNLTATVAAGTPLNVDLP